VGSDEAVTRGARTRAAVLAAARHRFADEGFDGTTGARIAADAGVSEPTIAFHFGSKAGLLVAVMRAYYDELLATIDEVLDDAAPPEQRLGAFAAFWLCHNAEELALLSVFGRHGRRSEPDEVVAAFRDCNRRVTRVFDALVEDLKHVGTVRADVPTRIVRDAFFGTTEHLMLGRALTGRPADLDAAADDLVALLLHGAAGPPAHPPPATGQDALDAQDAQDALGALDVLHVLDAKLDRVLERLDLFVP